MRLRALLVALIVLATAGFVIGTSIERSDKHATHSEATASGPSHTETGETGNEAAEHAGESGSASAKPSTEEFQPFGVDIEAVPFIVLAALASLGLALAAWLRPRATGLLLVVALAMLAFAVLDVREVVHQSDEGKTGLEVLAVVIAALHAGAAATATAIAA